MSRSGAPRAARLHARASSRLGFVAERLFFSHDGATLVARGDRDGALIAAASGAVMARGPGIPRDRHAWSASGEHVAIGGESLTLLDVRSGTFERIHDTSSLGAIVQVALSRDATLAALVTTGRTVVVLELPHGRVRFRLGEAASRDRWSYRSEHHGASFDDLGTRLLTYGMTVESTWGSAAHHGLPDEIDDLEDFWTVWDASTGGEITTYASPRSRHESGASTSTFVPGSGLVLEARLGRFFYLRGPDLGSLVDGHCEEGYRELHASSDGRHVVAVGQDGTATLFGHDGEPSARREGSVADPFNGFGLPLVVGEPAPAYRVSAEGGVLVAESWPESLVIARAAADPRSIAVQPWSGGRSFATLEEDRVTLWEVEG